MLEGNGLLFDWTVVGGLVGVAAGVVAGAATELSAGSAASVCCSPLQRAGLLWMSWWTVAWGIGAAVAVAVAAAVVEVAVVVVVGAGVAATETNIGNVASVTDSMIGAPPPPPMRTD